MEPTSVKYVGMYLRKSRGDKDSDLDKHRLLLTELCAKNKWEWIEYVEIETGDSIDLRPKMCQLLDDISGGMYDAVCVVDIDRLGRGDMGDQDRIKKVFTKSKTLIITPDHVYNLDNENDEFSIDIKGFIAHQEYKLIVKRLVQGKKIGARKGMWTNGTPPFPYDYLRFNDGLNEKGLIVNQEKLKTYRLIIDSIIVDKMTPEDIAIQFNKLGILSPRGSTWSSKVIRDVAIDKTHLGLIVSNKTKGNAHIKRKSNSKDFEKVSEKDWIIAKGTHEAVKTEKEHETILAILASRQKAVRRKPKEILLLTGIVKCGICGHTMSLWKREARGWEEYLKHCWYHDHYGVKCINKGCKSDILHSHLWLVFEQYEKSLQAKLLDGSAIKTNDSLVQRLDAAKTEAAKREKVIERLLDAYENGVYTVEELKKRRQKADSALQEINDTIQSISSEMQKFDQTKLKEKLSAIDEFKRVIATNDMDIVEKNRWVRTIIREIKWTYTDNPKPKIEILFT